MKTLATKRLAACVRFVALALGALLLAGCATTPTEVQRWAAADGAGALPRIEPELYSPKPELRQAALDALLKLPATPEVVKALTQATLSPDPDIRGQAGAAMLFNPNGDIDFFAITLVADPDPSVRKQMAAGLAAAGKTGPRAITEKAGVYLWGLTQDSEAEVRAAAVEGEASLGLNDPISYALDALRHDPEPRVRAAAARGLKGYISVNAKAIAPGLTRLPEVIATMCDTAERDTGQFTEVRADTILLFTHRVVETHWVAGEAAAGLEEFLPAHPERTDVVAAIAAAKAKAPEEFPTHLPKFHLPGSTL